MLIKSDWHIHSEASFDANLTLNEIDVNSKNFGFVKFGITDHLNFNDQQFLSDIKKSKKIVQDYQSICDRVVLGVELTPIEKPLFDYIAKNGTKEGYVAPNLQTPFEIELALTKSELQALGIRYTIGASHWRVDVPNARYLEPDLNACIKEWHRQQMFLACDDRVTILGHPWDNSKKLWYEDFSIIPKSMNNELACALKENNKYVECNGAFFKVTTASEKFRNQYAEFMRELFEKGIKVVYGSDAHHEYVDSHGNTEKYLTKVGFKEGDISEIAESDLW